MQARIYRPAKTAMQSGNAGTESWILDFEPESARSQDPLTGWVSSSDMRSQVHIKFDSKDDAIAYAERNAITFTVREPRVRRRRIKSYADTLK